MEATVRRCFLFSDIVGSTEVWLSHLVAMPASLALHDQLIEEAVRAQGGTTFKHVGDATYSVFDSCSSAARAVLEAQARLAGCEWPGGLALRVKWALHAGPCIVGEGDYFGPTLNLTARILGLAQPGQVLTSAAVAEELESNHTQRLGLRRFKGIPGPVAIYELLAPGASGSPLPLGGETVGESNLPRATSAFVGRDSLVRRCIELLRETPLVTILGPGGAGKTRLALEVAHRERGGYAGGVWLVELASIENPAQVVSEIARAVGAANPDRTDLAGLCEHIGEESPLLIIDNCEHVREETAQAVAGLLKACPSVKAIATSRIPLSIAGERQLPIFGLSLPVGDRAAQVMDSEAGKLFVDRARAVRPEFSVDEVNAPAVGRLLTRLDGLPLAIELAAAQLVAHDVEDIDRLITERAIRLESDDPSVLPHRRTTHATIDWSYQLLSEEDRRVAREFSVFSGGATLEAVRAVCGFDCAPQLQRLVLSSLVQFHPAARRYSMLELVRDFMADRLDEAGETQSARGRHLDWIVELAQEAKPQLDGPHQARWLELLEAEHPNVRVALGWAVDRDQRLRAAVALHWFWFRRGHMREGAAWIAGTLTGHVPRDPVLHAQAESALGVLHWLLGDVDWAREHLARSVELAEPLSDSSIRAGALANLAMVNAQRGDLELAQREFEAALRAFEASGDRLKQAHVLNNLGVVAEMQGQWAEAAGFVLRSAAIYEELGDPMHLALCRSNLASHLRKAGDFEAAIHHAKLAATELAELKDFGTVGFCLLQIGLVEVARGRWESAASLQGKTEALVASADAIIPPHVKADWEAACRQTQEVLGQETFALHFAAGEQQTVEVLLSKV